MNQSNYKISSEREIENLIAKYTYLLDKGDFAGQSQLFKYGRIGALGNYAEGPEAIEKSQYANLQLYPNGTPQTAHVTTNITIEINEDGKNATSSSYVTILQQDTERSFPLQPVMVGRYDDTFALIDGKWWFTERNLSLSLIGDLSHHAHPDGPATKNIK